MTAEELMTTEPDVWRRQYEAHIRRIAARAADDERERLCSRMEGLLGPDGTSLDRDLIRMVFDEGREP